MKPKYVFNVKLFKLHDVSDLSSQDLKEFGYLDSKYIFSLDTINWYLDPGLNSQARSLIDCSSIKLKGIQIEHTLGSTSIEIKEKTNALKRTHPSDYPVIWIKLGAKATTTEHLVLGFAETGLTTHANDVITLGELKFDGWYWSSDRKIWHTFKEVTKLLFP